MFSELTKGDWNHIRETRKGLLSEWLENPDGETPMETIMLSTGYADVSVYGTEDSECDVASFGAFVTGDEWDELESNAPAGD